MTGRERVLTALTGGQPDKVPFFDNVNAAARRMIMDREDFTDLDFARTMCFDALDFYGFTPPFAAVQENGSLVRGLIQTQADLDAWRPPVIDAAYLDKGRAFVDRLGDSGLALFYRTRFGPAFIIQSMGFETFCYALHDDLALVEAFADRFADWACELVTRAADIGFDFAWFADDIAFNTSLMFDPSFFRSVFMPRMRRVARATKMPWAFHSDGHLMPVLDDLLSLGMAGLNPIEPGAMDIEQLKGDLGNRLCLIGNIDLHYTLTQGTTQEVEDEVRRRIETIGSGGAYIIASSNSLTHYCKRENVFAMRDAIVRYRDYQ